jgi:glutamate/aspartate transport system substrate-binding protein
MKKHLLALAVLAIAGGAFAQANDTVAKAKASGVITMGVRDSSGALSYTLGDGKYAGYHVEICQRIIANVEKAAGRKLEVKYLPVTSQNRIPLVQNGTVDIECGSTTNNATRQKDVSFAVTTFVEEVRIAVKANSGITSIAQLNGKNVATTTGTTSVQTLRKNERAWRHRLQGSLRQGPCRQLPAAGVGPCRRLRDGRRHPGRQHRYVQGPQRLQDRR